MTVQDLFGQEAQQGTGRNALGSPAKERGSSTRSVWCDVGLAVTSVMSVLVGIRAGMAHLGIKEPVQHLVQPFVVVLVATAVSALSLLVCMRRESCRRR